jgi:glyoxylate reductase
MAPRPLVLLDVPLPGFLAELLEPLCQTVAWEVLEGAEDLSAIRGIYTYGHPRIDGPLLDRLPALAVISNFGVGVDHIALEAAAARRIPVGNTPGAVDGATADMTIALLLAAARNLVTGDRFARSPRFTRYDPSELLGLEVHRSTLGIIGLGRIGREVARRARGFDMQLLYHSRRRALETERELGAEYASLEALLERSHFVSLNVPLTPETHGMIGERELRRMRRDAVLINIARGGVVDHEALYRALKEGWIARAAIDVTEPEPLPRDHPLLRLENLVITPHLGSATLRTRRCMGEMARDNLAAGLAGEPLPHAVGAA